MNIDTLNLALRTGEGVCLKDNSNFGFIVIGGAGRDESGNYRYSGYWETKEKCYQKVGNFSGFSQDGLKELLETHTFIESRPLAYGDIVPNGTKVKILENAEEECEKYDLGWSDNKKEMIGKMFEIDYIDEGRYIIKDYYFPRTAFTVCVEEENKFNAEKAIAELTKLGRIKDGKIIV